MSLQLISNTIAAVTIFNFLDFTVPLWQPRRDFTDYILSNDSLCDSDVPYKSGLFGDCSIVGKVVILK